MATRIETPYTQRATTPRWTASTSDGRPGRGLATVDVMITPPAEIHSHHNDGDRLARFLIIQDGGLHYHARTMGFSY